MGKCSRQHQKQRFISISSSGIRTIYNEIELLFLVSCLLQDFLSKFSWIFFGHMLFICIHHDRKTKKSKLTFVATEQNGNNIKKIIYWMHIKCQRWRQKDDADDDYDQNQCQYLESQIHIVFCFEAWIWAHSIGYYHKNMNKFRIGDFDINNRIITQQTETKSRPLFMHFFMILNAQLSVMVGFQEFNGMLASTINFNLMILSKWPAKLKIPQKSHHFVSS